MADGLASDVVDLALREGPLLDRTGWLAAVSWAVNDDAGDPLRSQLPGLLDRVDDQYPEDRWQSALPLLRAGCRLGVAELVIPRLSGSGLSAAQVAEILLQERGPEVATMGADGRLMSLILDHMSWDDGDPAWWRGARRSGSEAAAIEAVMILATANASTNYPAPHPRHLWGLGMTGRVGTATH